MRKLKLVIAAVAMLSLVSGSAAYADGFAPGEGLYIGAFGAGDMGMTQAKVATQGVSTGGGAATALAGTRHDGGTFENTDGGFGLSGLSGGGMLGYGYKMGDLYAGIEGEYAAGSSKFKVTSSVDLELQGGQDGVQCPGCEATQTITAIEAEKVFTGGMFGRIGYYLNQDTLLSFRGGVLLSKFDVTITGTPGYSESYYGGGPSFGASMESRVSAIDPNLSLRIGAVYTDFLTASVFGIDDNDSLGNSDPDRSGHNSEVTGHGLSARIGIQYSFFDVNSLF